MEGEDKYFKKYEREESNNKYNIQLYIKDSEITFDTVEIDNSNNNMTCYLSSFTLDNLSVLNQNFKEYSQIEQAFDSITSSLDSKNYQLKKEMKGTKKYLIIILTLGNNSRVPFISPCSDISDKTQIETDIKELQNKFANLLCSACKLNKVETMFESNPENLKFKKDIITDATPNWSISEQFAIFSSLDKRDLLVYGTKNNFSIQFYDLKEEKVIHSIVNAHSLDILVIKYFLNILQNQEIIISSSCDKIVKLWDITSGKYNNILSISTDYDNYRLYSTNILFDLKENDYYIITSEYVDYIKIWNSKGSFIKSLGEKKQSVRLTEVYYEQNNSYIIVGLCGGINVYDFKSGELYKTFKEDNMLDVDGVKIININNVLTIISTDGNGNVSIWDFHKGNLIEVINTEGENKCLMGNCLWNQQYVLSGCWNKQIKIFNIKNKTFVKGIDGHSSYVCCVEKCKHPLYGECLVSCCGDGCYKLWTFE